MTWTSALLSTLDLWIIGMWSGESNAFYKNAASLILVYVATDQDILIQVCATDC